MAEDAPKAQFIVSDTFKKRSKISLKLKKQPRETDRNGRKSTFKFGVALNSNLL